MLQKYHNEHKPGYRLITEVVEGGPFNNSFIHSEIFTGGL